MATQQDDIQLDLYDIVLSDKGFIALLKPRTYTDKALFILVGFIEAQFLTIQFNKIATQRPLIIDLFHDLLNALNVKLKKVYISHYQDQVFYSKVFLEGKSSKQRYVFDARTSDALILALNFNAKIYANKSLIDKRAAFFDFYEDAETEINEYKQNRIKSLHKEIKQAIEEERYEDAAYLRDEIKKLKGE